MSISIMGNFSERLVLTSNSDVARAETLCAANREKEWLVCTIKEICRHVDKWRSAIYL